ncbi:MAG: hypothetical protein COU81_00190 [Candidatus Portnoybacteria bacterium CG10_big_fil_rev_8_21_14_0_10_36_7]|uniref:4Fe4S-binding SPASM domain-containing protein n=1 Tax=Candidatus Portnoybacteria bacterium CG10_big_fil_rev_8_21_14_0_10_36_7 TaxID=1974812 RepID=A0A2M8KF49_9BACT|nr:MAG: hypothetical protein COU81_00190 [Candidatus Portnoybacteria bacterium CG10_big_fil_rev_8_21_14_0_10_36_7]
MEKYYINPSSSLQLRCFAGLKNLSINPDGEVLLCLKRRAVGNVLTSNIKDILSSKSAMKERRLIKKCKKYCRIKGLNFSRGVKELFIR